jgi:hypothetical protein
VKAFSVSEPTSTALRALNYSPIVETLRRRIGSSDAVSLSSLLSNLGDSYGSVFTRLDCDREYGIELMSQSDMFSTEPCGRIIRRDSIPKPDAHRIRKWQLLIAGAGTLGENELYGRSIVADERHNGKYVGPDAVVLTFHEPGSISNIVAYTFFLTKVGVDVLRSASYGTKVLRIRQDILASIPLPLLNKAITARLTALICQALQCREEYAAAIAKAREYIEALPEFGTAKSMFSRSGPRCLVWDKPLYTLSAWNYASAGETLRYLQSVWPGRLADVVSSDDLFNGLRFARIPCKEPYGVDLFSQRDVFSMRPLPRRIVHPGFDDRLLTVGGDSILVGSHGQLNDGSLFGRAELAMCEAAGSAVTQDILRIRPQPQHLETLYAFLSTDLGTRLLRSTAVGTSVPSMHLGLLAGLPIPDLSADVGQQVRSQIRAAVSARQNAAKAEREASRIFQDEVLPEWLN